MMRHRKPSVSNNACHLHPIPDSINNEESEAGTKWEEVRSSAINVVDSASLLGWMRSLRIAWIGMHVVCGALLIVGLMVAQRNLHNSEECDMTWSQRQFLEIDTTELQQSTSSSYRLFKFMDQRDPRHQQFLRQPGPWMGRDWCLTTGNGKSQEWGNQTTVVLYVPGHGGSYEQSRSLGAHGLQLTRRHDAVQQRRVLFGLQSGSWSGDPLASAGERQFVFDVYALDFREEGGGLHGSLIRRQSFYLAKAVYKLADTCHIESIIIVAHSIGGYAARLAPIQFPQIQKYISNIITLGTPHAFPVLAFEPSLFRVHAQIQSATFEDRAIISICGGLRDELIPPLACRVLLSDEQKTNSSSLTVMGTSVMKAATEPEKMPPILGVDHRALAWCHNLLATVRTVVYELAKGQQLGLVARDRVEAVKVSLQITPSYAFMDDVHRIPDRLRTLFSFWAASAVELGLWYNAEFIFDMYSFVGFWCFLFHRFRFARFHAPLAALFYEWLRLYNMWPKRSILSFTSIAILAFVANGIFLLFHRLIESLNLTSTARDTLYWAWGCPVLVVLLAGDIYVLCKGFVPWNAVLVLTFIVILKVWQRQYHPSNCHVFSTAAELPLIVLGLIWVALTIIQPLTFLLKTIEQYVHPSVVLLVAAYMC